MMYYTNLWAIVLLVIALGATGEGQRALGFVAQVGLARVAAILSWTISMIPPQLAAFAVCK
jgi:hypothetical protein